MVMVMSHLWVSCPTIVPGSQAYFCVYFIITSAPTNYFPLSILATATSNFFWHASLISDMLGVHVPFQGCPFGRIFILTTLSRSAATAEANHYLGKSIKSNKIAPREQRSELDRFANQVLERLQQQTFFYSPNLRSEGGFSAFFNCYLREKQLIIYASSLGLRLAAP